MKVIKQGSIIEYKSRMGKRAAFLYCGKVKLSQYRSIYLLWRTGKYGNDLNFVTVEKDWIDINKNRIDIKRPIEKFKKLARFKKERYCIENCINKTFEPMRKDKHDRR